jgi:soluble lytic murein transglycosylase
MLVIFIFVLGLTFYPFFEKKFFYPLKYSEYVEQYCEEYDVEQMLCYSVIKAESSFDKDVKSNSGAIGLMQITLPTGVFIAEKMGIVISEEDLKDAETNIKFGVYYISYLKKKFASLYEILAAYNAGEGRVTEWLNDNNYSDDKLHLKTTPFKETNSYIERTLKYYNKYKIYYNN